MKMKTTLIDADVGKYAAGEEQDADHDALAAHALMQAIAEAESHWFTSQKAHSDWILWRADELMCEWTTSEPSSNLR